MKSHTKKYLAAALSAVLSAGPVGIASAHVLSAALGKNPAATDVLEVTCASSSGALRVDAQVNDVTPIKPPRLQVTVEKRDQKSTAIDPRDGDGKYSPFASVAGGPGAYTITVSKLVPREGRPDRTRGQAERYVLQYHCMVGGEHPDTDYRYIRNQ
jgi:hypothetical protein